MKKPYAFPILCLVLALVACGKKDDQQIVNAGAVQGVAPIGQPYWPNPTYPNTGDLQSFCNYYAQYGYSAVLSNGVCSITVTYSNQSWFSFQLGDLTPQISSIYAGQRVSVTTSGNPNVLVGNSQYGTGSVSFVSQTNGQLRFSKYSFSSYNVQQIQVQSCYNAPNAFISCQ